MEPHKDSLEQARRRIGFEFRDKLNTFPEGIRHNYCYQCGACVADCPANRYSALFNPRLIMLKALLGFEAELIRADSEIWNCTNCYTCSERCPQDVRPIDVIIAMKNMCVAEGKAPPLVRGVCDSVLATGITTKVTSLVSKRREEYGLPALTAYPTDDLDTMLQEEGP